jgi:hypothetical protein
VRTIVLLLGLSSLILLGALLPVEKADPKTKPSPMSQPSVTYTDIAQRAGIRFRHDNAASPEKYLVETMGAGCAWIDYDNDRLLDIYLVQSSDTRVYHATPPLLT